MTNDEAKNLLYLFWKFKRFYKTGHCVSCNHPAKHILDNLVSLIHTEIKTLEKQLQLPWETEPVIWDRFCKEKDKSVEYYKRHFTQSSITQHEYEWFSKGFSYGGYSND